MPGGGLVDHRTCIALVDLHTSSQNSQRLSENSQLADVLLHSMGDTRFGMLSLLLQHWQKFITAESVHGMVARTLAPHAAGVVMDPWTLQVIKNYS